MVSINTNGWCCELIKSERTAISPRIRLRRIDQQTYFNIYTLSKYGWQNSEHFLWNMKLIARDLFRYAFLRFASFICKYIPLREKRSNHVQFVLLSPAILYICIFKRITNACQLALVFLVCYLQCGTTWDYSIYSHGSSLRSNTVRKCNVSAFLVVVVVTLTNYFFINFHGEFNFPNCDRTFSLKLRPLISGIW